MSLVGFKAQNHTQQVAKHGADDEVDDRGTHPIHFAEFDAEIVGPKGDRPPFGCCLLIFKPKGAIA